MTELMKQYEAETGEEAVYTEFDEWLVEDVYIPTSGYVDWLTAKATAYDRLMSGGRKTLKEWANFLGKPVAVDNGVTVWAYDKVPELSGNLWIPIAWSKMYQVPRSLVDFSGDWKVSLTLPDGWEEEI